MKIPRNWYKNIRYIAQENSFEKMKSKDLQNIVLSKCNSGDHPRKIFRDLNCGSVWRTLQRWCKTINETSTINLSNPHGSIRAVRTKATI